MSRLKVNQIIPFNDFGIGVGAINNDVSSVFNIYSISQGVYLPRMTTAQRNLILSPKDGLIIYNIDTHAFEHYNSATPGWESIDGVQSINGLSAKIQFLSNGTSGTAPNWTQTGGNTNVLNIPFASGAGVTAGLLSKADYDSFNLRLYPVKNTKYVVKNTTLGPQDYNSIKDAVDSITDASISNPYIVIVGPGIYIEDTITMQPFVWVEGAEQDQTVIRVNSTGKHVIIGADNSGISKCLLTGATDPGFAAVYYQSLTGTTNTAFFVEDVRFGENDSLGIADGSFAATAIFLENCKFGSIYQFDHGFLARAGGRVVGRNCTTTGLTAPFPDYMFKATGTGSQIVLNGCQLRAGSITSGACLHLADGALLRASAVNIRMFGKALWIENVGAGSIADVNGALCEANTMDVQVDHPAADGTFTGSAAHLKVFVNPASSFSPVFACNALPSDGTGFVVIGSILQGDRFDRYSNLSLLVRKTTTLGVIEDVQQNFIDIFSGLTVTVLAGQGFLNDPVDIYLKQISWPNTNITLPADSTNYIYADTNNVIQFSPTLPSLETVIPLGRVNTNATGVRFIENSDLPMNHYGNKTELFFRQVLGPVFENGCLVTESLSNARRLDVTAGDYYFGVSLFSAAGGSEITWETFYRDGSGGFNSIPGENTVSNTQYDNNSGSLVSIPAGQYARHHLYVLGDDGHEKWFLIYAQATYASLAAALTAPLPTIPNFMSDAVVRVAGIIVQQGVTNIVSPTLDIRPRVGFAAPSGTAVNDHGSLTGLLDDDHPQYLLVNGTRAMTGPLNMGAQDITNVGLVDGVDVSNHAARHLPTGADPLTTAAPVVNLSAITTNSVGTANSLSRSDHAHAISTGSAVSQVPDQANATGTGSDLARADHIHNIATAAPSGTIGANSVNSQGISAFFTRSDHGHQLATGTPSTQTPDQANNAGTSNNLARADHIHAIATAVVVTIGTANTQGTSSAFARADHVHNHGAQTDPTLHAIVTTIANGFMSASDKVKLDGISAGAAALTNTPPVNVTKAAAAVGVATDAARADHKHDITTASAITLTPDQANTEGTSTSLARADHGHNIPTAIVLSIGTANAQGTASSFARSDHVHQGIHSLKVNSGTSRFGDINFVNGENISITDDGAGNFTINATSGSSTVNTTNNTQTTIATVPTTTDTTYLLEVWTIARRTGGSAGTAGDSASYIRRIMIKNVAGVVTLSPASPQVDFTAEDQTSWDSTMTVSGTNVLVRVTGATNNNISWKATYRIYSI